MAQETFSVAKAILKSKTANQHVQQYQFTSKSMVDACSKAARDLQYLEITGYEQEVLDRTRDVEIAEVFVSQYIQEIENRGKQSSHWKTAYNVSRVAKPIVEIFKQANFSPECSLALGLVGLFLIQPLHNKSEIEERLSVETEKLHEVISQVKYTKSNLSSPEVENEVQGLCAAIVDFLIHALKYQKKSGIVKILGGVINDFERRFQSFINKIKSHSMKIDTLAQRSCTTLMLDSFKTLDKTSSILKQLDEDLREQATSLNSRLTRFEMNLSSCQESIESYIRFGGIKYVHELSAIFFEHPLNPLKEKKFVRDQEKKLAPRERWENHIPLLKFPGWLKEDPRSMLWIGGRQNLRCVSWVSSFVVDFIEALDLERGTDVIYVLCQNGDQTEISPLIIFKRIIIQLLTAQPEMLIASDMLGKISAQRFSQANDSVEEIFAILEDVLFGFEKQCLERSHELFIIIDRVDLVHKESSSQRNRFFRALHQLGTKYLSIRIMFTSQVPLAELGEFREKYGISEIWVDTTRPSAMYSRQ